MTDSTNQERSCKWSTLTRLNIENIVDKSVKLLSSDATFLKVKGDYEILDTYSINKSTGLARRCEFL